MSQPQDIQQLVREVAAITGVAPPDSSLALAEEMLRDGNLCYVGLIGGKDVGKTSLVNALVERTLSVPAGFGRGTDEVIAYCHASVEPRVRELLAREAAGKHRVVTHDNGELARQVLLDLPDIDSLYEQHVAMTRQMLRYMLFPVWIQSVEKYADAAPRRLLQSVAEGNDPSNFVFVINKVDQVVDREGPAAVEELRRDYAERIATALSLPSIPTVHAVAAVQPARFDLPRLRGLLMQPRTAESVESAARRATVRRDQTLLRWIDGLGLDRRRDSLRSLERNAKDLLDAAVVAPLLAETLPAVLDSASFRWSITEDASRARLARWPIVRVLDALLYPLTGLVRRNVSPGAANVNVMPLASRLQGVFLRLEQMHPSLRELYAPQRPWETPEAEQSIAELQRELSRAVDRLRREAVATTSRSSRWQAPFRWLLTIGAAAWFPFVQPLLEVVLANHLRGMTLELAIWIVRVLGASYLLQSVGFLLIWYLALWAWIRFSTHRRVGELVDGSLSQDEAARPTPIVRKWADERLRPIRAGLHTVEDLLSRVDQAREELASRETEARATEARATA